MNIKKSSFPIPFCNRKILWPLMIVLLSLGLSACSGGGGGGGGNPPVGSSPPATGIKGSWNLYGLTTGDESSGGWNGGWQGTIELDKEGQPISFYTQYSDDTSEAFAPFSQITMNPNGGLTLMNDTSFHGSITRDKNIVIATFGKAEPSLIMLVRPSDSSTASDFTGPWLINALASGDSPELLGWYRGTTTIDTTGKADLRLDSSYGEYKALKFFSFSPNGILENPNTHMTLSRDNELIAGITAYEGVYTLEIGLKPGNNPSAVDLEGYWNFHTLSTGDAPQANAWGYGLLHINDAGLGTVNYQVWSDETSVFSPSQTPSFQAQISRNKELMVATYTNQSGGASLMIATKRDDPPMEIRVEENNSASKVITLTGGVIEATADNGTRYTLEIPPNAFFDAEEADIKLTPLTNLGGVPVSGGFLAGVQLFPEGLFLSTPAKLTIDLPSLVPLVDLLAFSYQDAGEGFYFVPLYPDNVITSPSQTSLVMSVSHFSGAGAGTGTSADITPSPDPTSAGDYINQLAKVAKEMVAAGDSNFQEGVTPIFSAWFDDLILPNVTDAFTPDMLFTAINEYLAWEIEAQKIFNDTINAYDGPEDPFNIVGQIVGSVIDFHFMSINERCINEPDKCQRIDYWPLASGWMVLSQWAASYLGLINDSLTVDGFCDGFLSNNAEKIAITQGLPFSMNIGDSVQLDYQAMNYLQEDISIIGRKWASSNPGVAFVDENTGQVSAISSGMAFISVFDEYRCVSETVEITVTGDGSIFYGIYDLDVYGINNKTCDVIPVIANPTTAKVRIDFDFFANVQYTADNAAFMVGTMTDNKVRVSGDWFGPGGEGIQHGCDLTFSSLDSIKGDCDYRQLVPYVCKGSYEFTGIRLKFEE